MIFGVGWNIELPTQYRLGVEQHMTQHPLHSNTSVRFSAASLEHELQLQLLSHRDTELLDASIFLSHRPTSVALVFSTWSDGESDK